MQTQFEATKHLLKNLSNYNLTPATKLILAGLSCHLPKIKVQQKTIAKMLGVDSKTVQRAFKELKDKGYINMKDDGQIVLCEYQNVRSITDKMSAPCINKKENKKEQRFFQNEGIKYQSAKPILEQIERDKKLSVPPTKEFLELKKKLFKIG